MIGNIGGVILHHYAHDASDVEKLLAVYDEVFPLLRDAVENRSIRQLLRCAPLQPLFKVR